MHMGAKPFNQNHIKSSRIRTENVVEILCVVGLVKIKGHVKKSKLTDI